MSDTSWVFIHGVNNTPRVWEAVIAELPSEIVHRCPQLEARDDLDVIAGELLQNLPASVVLVGHSLGGYVALALLERAPERVAAIALINSSSAADTPQMRDARMQLARAARTGGYQDIVAGATQKAFHPDRLSDAALMAARADDVRDYGAERFAAHQLACASRPDRTALLAGFTGPKLVIAAAEDAVIPAAAQREMATKVGAEFVLVPDTGHMLPAEAPETVAQLLLKWCDESAVG